jgi:hypothetical protein
MAKTTDKAVYYDTNLKGATLDILKHNEDGTKDIGLNGKVMVRLCPVVKSPKHGYCTLGDEPVEVVKPEDDQTAADAASAAKVGAESNYKSKI